MNHLLLILNILALVVGMAAGVALVILGLAENSYGESHPLCSLIGVVLFIFVVSLFIFAIT